MFRQMFSLLLIMSIELLPYPSYSQQQCGRNDPLNDISKLNCEVKRSQACVPFFNNFTDDFQKRFGLTCPDADEGSLFKSTALCGGLTLSAGLSIWQTLTNETQTAISKKIPVFLQKFGPKLLPYLSIFGSVATIYSVTDILNESIKQDEKCFKNIEKKQATIAFLEATSKHLLERTQGIVDEFQARQLSFPEDYRKPKFIEQLPCQSLNEIVTIQKKKQDAILGKLIASGKLKADPRKELGLTDEELNQTQFLLENMQCLSTRKRIEILCALGNTAMGGLWLKQILGSISNRPIDISGSRKIKYTSRDDSKRSDFQAPTPLSMAQQSTINKIHAQTDKLEAAVKSCGDSLTTNICRGATGTLIELLKKEGITATPMRNSYHTFLRIENFYGPGKHLIVDPTYRQFIRRTFKPEDPRVYVGNEEGLIKILTERGAYKPNDFFEGLVPDPGVPSIL